MPGRLAPLHGTGQLYGTPEQEQLFGKRGFTRIRVGNNGKGATSRHLISDVTHMKPGEKNTERRVFYPILG
jgi:hypothetical protein